MHANNNKNNDYQNNHWTNPDEDDDVTLCSDDVLIKLAGANVRIPLKPWYFSGFLTFQLLKIYCDDHSSLSYYNIYVKHHFYFWPGREKETIGIIGHEK